MVSIDSRKERHDHLKRLQPLVGGTIIDVSVYIHPDYTTTAPVLIIEGIDGDLYDLTPMRDTDSLAPGYLECIKDDEDQPQVFIP